MKTRLVAIVLAVLSLTVLLLLPRETHRMRIEIFKSQRRVEFHDGNGGVRSFRAALGFHPSGHKQAEGDGATPEGEYFICTKNPRSRWFLSLGISYPGPGDADCGLAQGLIGPAEHAEILRAWTERRTPPWKTALGGEIFIHGRGSQSDWTAGCVALDDSDMAELYDLVDVGTPVVIRP